MEPGGVPAGREAGNGVPAPLAEALAGMAPGALADVAEFIVLHREFPRWAVWLPRERRQWIAARPASNRTAGPDLPMIWVRATTAASLADQMRAADTQLPVDKFSPDATARRD